MPYLPTAQEWLKQSALLLQARPTTARITTKYTLTPPSKKPKSKSKASKPSNTESTDDTTTNVPTETSTTTAPPPTTRATLTLKTYDPASGVTLKYETDKAAEVGRLISSLARLGRSMAGLPELKDDVVMLDTQAVEGVEVVVSGVATPVPDGGAKPGAIPGAPVGGAQGGKKGKKKGKK